MDSWNAASRTLTFAVTNENRGGFALSQTTVTSIQAASGVAFDSPATPVPLGPLAIRDHGVLDVGATLPQGVNYFFVTWSVTGTAANGSLASYTFTKPVSVPPATAQLAKLKPVLGSPHVATSGWELLITEPNLEASVESPTVVFAQVRNQTGSALLLSDLYVRLATTASPADFSLAWAPEFIATGGLIPPEGFSGPLVQLTWHAAPPLSSIATGFIELHTAAPVDNPIIAGSFVVTYQLQSLQVALDGAEVLITWPASATGLRLQQSNDLLDPQSWFWPDQTPETLGDGTSLRLPVSEAVGFFRLGTQ